MIARKEGRFVPLDSRMFPLPVLFPCSEIIQFLSVTGFFFANQFNCSSKLTSILNNECVFGVEGFCLLILALERAAFVLVMPKGSQSCKAH